MTAKPTPGPWRAERWLESKSSARLLGPQGELLAVFYDIRDEGVANLTACAALPALLAVVEAAEACLCRHAEPLPGCAACSLRSALTALPEDLT